MSSSGNDAMASMQLLFRDFLLEKVVTGGLLPGAPLDFDSLKEEFDEAILERPASAEAERLSSPSRSTYRAVVEELADLLVLDVSTGSSPKVRTPNREELLAHAAVRATVESMCVYRISEFVQPARHEAIATLVRIHNDLARLKKGDCASSSIQFVLTDWQFHRSLCSLSGLGFAESTVSRTFWSFVLNGMARPGATGPDASSRDVAVCEHRLILSAMMLGNGAAASMAIRYHILTATGDSKERLAAVASSEGGKERQEDASIELSDYEWMINETRRLSGDMKIPFEYNDLDLDRKSDAEKAEKDYMNLASLGRCFD